MIYYSLYVFLLYICKLSDNEDYDIKEISRFILMAGLTPIEPST